MHLVDYWDIFMNSRQTASNCTYIVFLEFDPELLVSESLGGLVKCHFLGPSYDIINKSIWG